MKSLKNRPIGIFDSGVGGLTVARSIRRVLPNEDIIYFGDTARVPYGNKSRSTIIRFAREIMDFMMKKQVKMIVVACNTASSLGLPLLKKGYTVPVMGVITPGVKKAVGLSKNGKIGVIGTKSTTSSGSYERELKRVSRKFKLYSKSCPLFVPLVENRVIADEVACKIAKGYLTPLKARGVDTLILGCTHYPALKSVIQKVMGKVRLVDSSLAVAQEVKEELLKKDLANPRKKSRGRVECFVSDDVEGFRSHAGIFFKEKYSVRKTVL